MKIIGIIPARWASTRFPGKVLADLNGKPMIQYVWEQAKKAEQLDAILIACDEQKVLDVCSGFGANAVMTSADHASGTDRIIEAVKDVEAEIVINIQGDEPMISPGVINDLAQALLDDADCPMATVIKKIDDPTVLENPNIVKVVIDCHGYALYFSRHSIPYNRDEKKFEEMVAYKHLGLYAYRKKFLLKFNEFPESTLEQIEKLEQLRVLEAGYRIKTIQTEFETIGVDAPQDLERVADLLSS